ncbi:MAG: dihydrolipoyl dehydrogenase [Acidobacteriota bacterium]
MAEDTAVDVAVIGAGPGGYVAALRAAQLGLQAVVIEKEFVGGTCLNVGCIPSKALLDATHLLMDLHRAEAFGIHASEVRVDFARMQAHKSRVVQTLTRGVSGLLRRQGVELIEGTASFAAPGRVEIELAAGGQRMVRAGQVIIATGSTAAALTGVAIDGERVVSSRDALAFEEIPERLIVIGAGYIGLELGSVYARLGSRVVVLEMMDRVLPEMDEEVAATAARLLTEQGLDIRLGAKVRDIEVEESQAIVRYEHQGKDRWLTAERVLMAVGRRPYLDGLGLEAVGLEVDERGFLGVDGSMRTAVKGVLAIGDVVATPMLAHVAMDEGVVAAETIAGQASVMEYDAIPAVVYMHPELASVGLKEEEARDKGFSVAVGKFPFRGNGRARARGEVEGWVKIIADTETDALLGVHCVGPEAGHLIHEAVVAMGYRGYAEDLALTVHAHPTLSEAFKEAALAVAGRSLHI